MRKEKLLRILSNLLANAVSNSIPEGGHVYFQVDDVVGCLQVCIKDTYSRHPRLPVAVHLRTLFQWAEDTPPALPERKDEYLLLFGGSSALQLPLARSPPPAGAARVSSTSPEHGHRPFPPRQ